MHRGPLAWILAGVGVIAVIVVAAAIGGRDKSDETVPAGEWAQSVCGAVGVWRGEFEAVIEDIRTPAAFGDAGVDEPQSETPQTRRGFVRAGLEIAVQATDTLVEGIDNAGTPDTAQGEQAAQQLSDWAELVEGPARAGAGLAGRGGGHPGGSDPTAHDRGRSPGHHARLGCEDARGRRGLGSGARGRPA